VQTEGWMHRGSKGQQGVRMCSLLFEGSIHFTCVQRDFNISSRIKGVTGI
jgi:hypothetical protein